MKVPLQDWVLSSRMVPYFHHSGVLIYLHWPAMQLVCYLRDLLSGQVDRCGFLALPFQVNRCIQCSNGTYSLNATNPYGCLPCPASYSDCSSGFMAPKPGFFQPDPLLPQLVPCPLRGACPAAVDPLALSWQLLQRAVHTAPKTTAHQRRLVWTEGTVTMVGMQVVGDRLDHSRQGRRMKGVYGATAVVSRMKQQSQPAAAATNASGATTEEDELVQAAFAQGGHLAAAARAATAACQLPEPSADSSNRTCLLLAMQRSLAVALTNDSELTKWDYRQEMIGWQQMQCKEGYTGPLCGTCMPAVSGSTVSAAAAASGGGIGASLSMHALRGYGRLSFRCVACRPFAMELSVLVVLFVVQCMYLSLGILLQLRAPKRILMRRGDTLRSYRRDAKVAAGAASGAWSAQGSWGGSDRRRRGGSGLGGSSRGELQRRWRGGSVESGAYSADGSWGMAWQESGDVYGEEEGRRGRRWDSRGSLPNEINEAHSGGVTGGRDMIDGGVPYERGELELAERGWRSEGHERANENTGMSWRRGLGHEPTPLVIPESAEQRDHADAGTSYVSSGARNGHVTLAPWAVPGEESSPAGTGSPRSLPELPETPLTGKSCSPLPSPLPASSQGGAAARAAVRTPFALPAAAVAALTAADGGVSAASPGSGVYGDLTSAPTLADGVPTEVAGAWNSAFAGGTAAAAAAAAAADPLQAESSLRLTPVMSIQIAKGGLNDSAGDETGATFWPYGPATPFVDSAPDTPFASGFVPTSSPFADGAPGDSPFVDTAMAFGPPDREPCSSPFVDSVPSGPPSVGPSSFHPFTDFAPSRKGDSSSSASYDTPTDGQTRSSSLVLQGGFLGLGGVPHTIWEGEEEGEERLLAAAAAAAAPNGAAYPALFGGSGGLGSLQLPSAGFRQPIGLLREQEISESAANSRRGWNGMQNGTTSEDAAPKGRGPAVCKDIVCMDAGYTPLMGKEGECGMDGGNADQRGEASGGDRDVVPVSGDAPPGGGVLVPGGGGVPLGVGGLPPGAMQPGTDPDGGGDSGVVGQKMLPAATLVGIWKILTNYLQVREVCAFFSSLTLCGVAITYSVSWH